MSRKQHPKSKGTVMAEKIRSNANGLTDAQRDELIKRAHSMIHGTGPDKPSATR